MKDYPEIDGYITELIPGTEERYLPSALTLRRRENERIALGLSKADYDKLVRQAEDDDLYVKKAIRKILEEHRCVSELRHTCGQ